MSQEKLTRSFFEGADTSKISFDVGGSMHDVFNYKRQCYVFIKIDRSTKN